MTSLQSLLPAGTPWHIWSVWGINDHNQIVGAATNSVSGTYESVLLTVPEPSTFSMLFVCGAVLIEFWWLQSGPARHNVRRYLGGMANRIPSAVVTFNRLNVVQSAIDHRHAWQPSIERFV